MNKRGKKALASAVVMGLVLTTALNSTKVKADEVQQVNRLGGDDRFKTAEEVAKNLFKTSDNVVLVNGLGYADAVSAAPFAKQLNAPILLTGGKVAEDDLLKTLKALSAKNIYVIGGEGVVSQEVVQALKEYKVERIAGATRYETNAEIAKRVLANSNTKGAILVNGEDGYADSLSVAPIAAKKGYAILFGNSKEVPKVIRDAAAGLNVMAVGGQQVLPDDIIKSVNGKRITEKAANRFETNLSLVNYFKDDLNFDNIFIASGGSDSTSQFADSLVASAAAAKYGAPLVLSGLGASSESKNSALEYIKANIKSNTKVSLIGSSGVMSNDIEENIKSILNDKKIQVNNSSSSSSSSSSGGNNSSGSTTTGSSINVNSGDNGNSNASVVKGDDLNKAGSYTGDCTISSIVTQSTFGPESGVTSLNGNLNISIPNAADGQNIKLRNLDIKGNLSVDFGSGNVELENVKVNGVTVTNIGQNSLHIKGDTHIGTLNIQDTDSNAHVVIESANAAIDDTNINSGAKLELGKDINSLNPFGSIKISPSKEGDTIILDGTFGSVEIEKGAKLQIASSAKILGTLVVKSGADISLGDNAEVKKLDISTENESDKISLDGSFTNVEINKKADIEVKSGISTIIANIPLDINVSKDASIVAKGNTGNINAKGEGTKEENASKSSDNTIKNILINSVTVEYGSEIKNVPAGMKVGKLLENIQLPDFATAWVEVGDQEKLSEDDYLPSFYSSLVVQAEDGNRKYYNIQVAQDNSHSTVMVKFDGFNDTNLNENKLSSTLNFTVEDSEEDIQGYYINIWQRIHEYDFINSRPIYYKFVPYNKDANKKYSVSIDNIDISKIITTPSAIDINEISKDLPLEIGAVYKNRALIPEGNEDWHIIDLPRKSSKPSSNDGVTLSFTDTNSEKGKIAGTITVTKAKDEANIKYYELKLFKAYEVGGTDTGTVYDIGYIDAKGQDTYTYELPYEKTIQFGLENAKDITLYAIPVNEYGEAADNVSEKIVDVGSNDSSQLKAPLLNVTTNEAIGLTVTDFVQDAEIRLYVFDEGSQQYKPYLRNGQQLVTYPHSNTQEMFYDLEPGKYKVTQYINGKESDMSNEVLLKPEKLTAVIQGSTVIFTNAQVGATITLYDENKNVVSTIGVNTVTDAKFDNLQPGKYYVNQYMNKVDGDYSEFEITNN